MKIVIYEANSEVPFSDFSKKIGTNKIIFSNAKERIEELDKEQTRPLLVTSEDNTIFYVPEKISDWFEELVKNVKNTELETLDVTEKDKHSLKKIGVVGSGWEKLTQFFEEMRIKWVLRKKKCPEEIMDFMNRIVRDETNSINAIFVYDLRDKTIVCHTDDADEKGQLLKNVPESIAKSLGSLKSTYDMLSRFGETTELNESKYGIFQFSGGILNLYFPSDLSNMPIIVGFVTVKEKEKIGTFLIHCAFHIEDIRAMLENWYRH